MHPLLGLEHVYWGMPLVLYPFFSGLVAGSFVVSTLSKVFGLKKFEPLAKLGVSLTLVFLLIAALCPLAEATMRSRWWELLTRDHIPYSPLGLFIVIWLAYIVLVLVELYLIFRPDNIRVAQYGHGWRRSWHSLLTLGSRNTSDVSIRRDHLILVVLSAFGILLALLFHGYVGFVFGALKARSLWSNPLMPPLFIVSAIVSGIAVMVVAFEIIEGGVLGRQIDREIVAGLMKLLMWVIFLDLFLDAVQLLNSAPSAYASEPVYQGFSSIFFYPDGPLAFSYWILELGFLVLALLMTFLPSMRRSVFWSALASVLVLVSVFAMRFNTVIGAQLQPKVSQGLVSYNFPTLGLDSLQVAIGLVAIVVTFTCLVLLLLPWEPSWVETWIRKPETAPDARRTLGQGPEPAPSILDK